MDLRHPIRSLGTLPMSNEATWWRWRWRKASKRRKERLFRRQMVSTAPMHGCCRRWRLVWKVAQIVSRRDWIHHQWCWIVVDVVVVIQVITDHIHTWRVFAVLS